RDGLRPWSSYRRIGLAKRHDHESEQGRRNRDGRSKQVEQLIDMARNNLLFEQKLDAVGDGLQQTKRSDAVGPDAILHPRTHLAFEQTQIGARPLQHPKREDDEDQRDPEVERIMHPRLWFRALFVYRFSARSITPYSPRSPDAIGAK